MSLRVVCNYCQQDAELVEKLGALEQMVWLCRPCKAWVPAQRNSLPFGILAKSRLRQKRTHALYEFDRVRKLFVARYGWSKAHRMTRGWVALEMGIHEAQFNIYAFDEVRTQIVIEICRAVQIVRVAA
jgi:hypothetical protein